MSKANTRSVLLVKDVQHTVDDSLMASVMGTLCSQGVMIVAGITKGLWSMKAGEMADIVRYRN